MAEWVLRIWSLVPGTAPAEFDRTISSRPFTTTLDRMWSLNGRAIRLPELVDGDQIAAEFSQGLLEVRMPDAKPARPEDPGAVTRAGQRTARSPSRSLKTEI